MKPLNTNKTQCTINFMGNTSRQQKRYWKMQDSVYFEWDSMTLNPKSTSTSNLCQDFEEWLYQSVCAVCQHRSIMIIMHFKFTSLWLFKKFLSYFLLQSNDFLKLIFLLCLFVIQCYMTAWLGFFLYASRSCSHTNQDVRGLGSYGFTSGQILLLILPCVMTSGNITTGLQRVLRLIWYT